MIDMPHNRHHRWAADEILGFIKHLFKNQLFIKSNILDRMPELLGNQTGSVKINHLVDGYHTAHDHQLADHFPSFDAHLFSQFTNAYDISDLNHPFDLFGHRDLGFLAGLLFPTPAAAALAAPFIGKIEISYHRTPRPFTTSICIVG